ncbi:MAG: hypothetical protein WC342_07990 [Methanoregula sp.]|jgi:hypothetical protein
MADSIPPITPDYHDGNNPANTQKQSRTSVSEVQNLEDLLRSVGKDPETTPLSEAKEIARIVCCSRETKDRNFYRWVFIILGIFVAVTIAGSLLLALLEKPVPEGMVVLGSFALGLFAGILVMYGREG